MASAGNCSRHKSNYVASPRRGRVGSSFSGWQAEPCRCRFLWSPEYLSSSESRSDRRSPTCRLENSKNSHARNAGPPEGKPYLLVKVQSRRESGTLENEFMERATLDGAEAGAKMLHI